MIYAFWNNKGGTGKTSLAFQAICSFAQTNQDKSILVVDACPQANLSELLLGGLTGGGSYTLLTHHGAATRRSIGGYFQIRLPSPYAPPVFNPRDYIIKPSLDNSAVPHNIDLLSGDPLLELQSNAINTLSNSQIPGINPWIAVLDWMRDFIRLLDRDYDYILFDCNPSFSVYTQIALSTCDRIIIPVMADDSSRRAVQNALSLVYGLSLPSPIYIDYAFSSKLTQARRNLPKVHLLAKNRLTQYMGPASAYAAVLHAIDQDITQLLVNYPNYFTFTRVEDGVVEVRDFQTTGVVAFAKGLPFSVLRAGKQDIGGHRVQVKEDYRQQAIAAIEGLVQKI